MRLRRHGRTLAQGVRIGFDPGDDVFAGSTLFDKLPLEPQTHGSEEPTEPAGAAELRSEPKRRRLHRKVSEAEAASAT